MEQLHSSPVDEATGRAIRHALDLHGKLKVAAADVSPDADLYGVGLTSHASVNVMLEIETILDIEFPEELLKRDTFASIDAIEHAVAVASE
jgi:acyl carrier protein